MVVRWNPLAASWVQNVEPLSSMVMVEESTKQTALEERDLVAIPA